MIEGPIVFADLLVAALSLILGTLVLAAVVLVFALATVIIETLETMIQRDGSQSPPVKRLLALAAGLALTLAVSQVALEAFMSVSPAVFPGAIIVGVGEGVLGLIAGIWLVYRNGRKQRTDRLLNESDGS